MTYAHTRRVLATIVAAACIAVPASASASDGLASSDRTDAAQSGSTTSPSIVKSTFPPADFRGGDIPVDHPGASRASTTAPTTVEIVRPVRTIVRDVDDALPLILAGTALLLALVAVGITLARIRMVPRPGHSH